MPIFKHVVDGKTYRMVEMTPDEEAKFEAERGKVDDPIPKEISDRQFFQALAIAGAISKDEALDAVKTGAIPATVKSVIDTMPADQKFNAEMHLSGAVTFHRSHPLTSALGAALGWDGEKIDNLWREAAKL